MQLSRARRQQSCGGRWDRALIQLNAQPPPDPFGQTGFPHTQFSRPLLRSRRRWCEPVSWPLGQVPRG